MFHKVKAVRALDNYILEIEFVNGKHKFYDVAQLFEQWEEFKSLKTTYGLFKQVKVDKGGYGISWNKELDLSCDELYSDEL